MPSPPPRPRGRDLFNRLADWVSADRAWPDLAERLERLWSDAEVPSLSRLTERFQWDVEWPGIDALLERVQTDATWTRLVGFIDRLQAEVELPSFASLAEKLQVEFDLPEMSATLAPQHRQALRGVLLLGMVLHSGPVPLTKTTAPLTGGPTSIAETRGVSRSAMAQAMADAGYALRSDLAVWLDSAGSPRGDASATHLAAASVPVYGPLSLDSSAESAPRSRARRPLAAPSLHGVGARAPPV